MMSNIYELTPQESTD